MIVKKKEMDVYLITNNEFDNITLSGEKNFLKDSSKLLLNSRKINLIGSVLVILIGLVGNLTTVCFFSQKKFRINSSHVYLFVLAINDSLFMVVHFFEDTIRTFSDIYLSSPFDHITKLLNVTDHFEISCRLVNFFRYSLRFISSYIVVAYAVQHLFIVYKPLTTSFQSKKSAWKTIKTLVCIAFIINMWVPYFFQINTNYYDQSYCDIKPKLKTQYFKVTIIFIALVILIPINQ